MEQTKQYEYVDLGLPSGLKWATMNVGATSEADYGSYFQWGDIEDKSNSDCSWENYKYCKGTYKTLTKYCINSLYGTVDNKTTLESEDDASIQIIGGDWRMPTATEFQELYDNTTNEWVEGYNGSGVNGRKFTSKTDTSKYIFIPAAGYRSVSSFYNQGRAGSFWSSSLYSGNHRLAFYFDNYLEWVHSYADEERYKGFVVRGVRK